MAKGLAESLADASQADSRAKVARRVGSAKAAKVELKASEAEATKVERLN